MKNPETAIIYESHHNYYLRRMREDRERKMATGEYNKLNENADVQKYLENFYMKQVESSILLKQLGDKISMLQKKVKQLEILNGSEEKELPFWCSEQLELDL